MMSKLSNLLGGRRATPAETGYDVFLIAGQSNALGAGIGHDAVIDRAHPHVHQFAGGGRNAGKVLTGEHPLWHHTRAPGVGFGVTFGNLHAEATGRPVLLVPAARGQSGFVPQNGFSWDVENHPDTFNLFRYACRQLDTALAEGPDRVLRGILWHQGESDVRHGMHSDDYLEKMDALITGFRQRFGTVPFILGQMSPDRMAEYGGAYLDINAAHHAIPSRVELSACVEAPSGMFNSPDDKIHFNAAGQRELGRRYYEEYRRLAQT